MFIELKPVVVVVGGVWELFKIFGKDESDLRY